MYRSTLCSYFHIILLNIMQINFKHILLFIIICFLIYLDYNWYISTDFTLDKSRQMSRNTGIFIFVHIILGLLILLLC